MLNIVAYLSHGSHKELVVYIFVLYSVMTKTVIIQIKNPEKQLKLLLRILFHLFPDE